VSFNPGKALCFDTCVVIFVEERLLSLYILEHVIYEQTILGSRYWKYCTRSVEVFLLYNMVRFL
jgi:hypothetical protein